MEDEDEKFSKERRRAPRVSGAIVEYTSKGNEVEVKKAFIKDICVYGICIYVPESVEIGTVLKLNIFLFGDDSPIKSNGKVVWQKSGGYLGYFNMGIEFENMSKKTAQVLNDHIAANYKGGSEG